VTQVIQLDGLGDSSSDDENQDDDDDDDDNDEANDDAAVEEEVRISERSLVLLGDIRLKNLYSDT